MDRYRLLIAEDEPDLREVLAELHPTDRFEVIQAVDGKAAWDIIRDPASNLDAVLSDINMPSMDGLELLATARRHDVWTPFVFLTGYGDKDKVLIALRNGAFEFLEKPCHTTHLIKVTSDAARLGRLMKEVEMEIDAAMESIQGTEEERKKARASLRDILMIRKQREALADPKKAG